MNGVSGHLCAHIGLPGPEDGEIEIKKQHNE